MGTVCRYMIIYHYGGVYADMDTVCRKPVEAWAPRGCHFAVATETDVHFCQWAFAGVAGHGALGRVLELVLQRMQARVWQAYIAEDNWEFVHEVTGPSVFTEGILDYLRIPHTSHDDVNLYQLIHGQREEWRQRGVCLLTWAEMQKMLQNQYSSTTESLQDGSWRSWTQEREALMKEAAFADIVDYGGPEESMGQDGQPESDPGPEGQRVWNSSRSRWVGGDAGGPGPAMGDDGRSVGTIPAEAAVPRAVTQRHGSADMRMDERRPQINATRDGAPEEAAEGDGEPEEAAEGDGAPEEAAEGDGEPEEAAEGDGAPEEAAEGDDAPEEAAEGDGAPEEAAEGDDAPAEAAEGDGEPEEAAEGDGAPAVGAEERQSRAHDGRPDEAAPVLEEGRGTDEGGTDEGDAVVQREEERTRAEADRPRRR